MTRHVIALVILGFFYLSVLGAGGRLIWGLLRGDLQIESTSHGKQFRKRREHLDEDSD